MHKQIIPNYIFFQQLQTMTGSYSEILERPLLKQGIAEEEDDENEKIEDGGKEEVSSP